MLQFAGSERSRVTPFLGIVTSQAPFSARSPVAPVFPSCSFTPFTTMVVSPPSFAIQPFRTVPSRRPAAFTLTWSFGSELPDVLAASTAIPDADPMEPCGPTWTYPPPAR